MPGCCRSACLTTPARPCAAALSCCPAPAAGVLAVRTTGAGAAPGGGTPVALKAVFPKSQLALAMQYAASLTGNWIAGLPGRNYTGATVSGVHSVRSKPVV